MSARSAWLLRMRMLVRSLLRFFCFWSDTIDRIPGVCRIVGG